MKIGDLLYYRPPGSKSFEAIGIALALEEDESELKMKTLWFDDLQCTLEPMPGSVFWSGSVVGVLSATR